MCHVQLVGVSRERGVPLVRFQFRRPRWILQPHFVSCKSLETDHHRTSISPTYFFFFLHLETSISYQTCIRLRRKSLMLLYLDRF